MCGRVNLLTATRKAVNKNYRGDNGILQVLSTVFFCRVANLGLGYALLCHVEVFQFCSKI
jgi:hypothetical protein